MNEAEACWAMQEYATQLVHARGQPARAQRVSLASGGKSLWAVKADPHRACEQGDVAQACPALPGVLADTRMAVERAAVCALRRPDLSLLFFSLDLDNKQLSLRS